jgi:hypothetical protein
MKNSVLRTVGAAAALLTLPAAIVAQADGVETLLKEFQARQTATFSALRKMKQDSPEVGKRYAEYEEYVKKFGPRALNALKTNPKSPSAFPLLRLLLLNCPNQNGATIEVIRTRYVADPKAGELCGFLAYDQSQAAEETLLAIREKNPSPAAKGSATYYLGRLFLNRFGVYSNRPVPEVEQAEAIKRAESYLADARDNYAGKHIPESKADVERTMTALRNAPNLRVGKVAPEIAGEDVEGVQFKLSDYRGTVILLDFWGHW